MNEYLRNLVGNFAGVGRFIAPDTRLEKSLRLALSDTLIVIGLYSVNQGYEVAYSDGEFYPLLRPDGNSDHYFFDMVGAVAWIVCLLGNRLRTWSWAFVIFFAWWCYTATSYYLDDRYYVMGQDGGLPCGERIADLHLGVGAFGLCAALFATIFRLRKIAARRI
ncbi:hypothetical protein FHT86_004559 [Rhizobium sp. BK313]|uniref:hypothetical protein n=1 Tax=Rhizobium sp. BK313 TaxID=2587081 RepID=UPI00105D53DE|nr:hypothetical protein [Rhizobium sp. BK313]MBB3456251.1 hypothetical protein [Rhizobium sp. BK313]